MVDSDGRMHSRTVYPSDKPVGLISLGLYIYHENVYGGESKLTGEPERADLDWERTLKHQPRAGAGCV